MKNRKNENLNKMRPVMLIVVHRDRCRCRGHTPPSLASMKGAHHGQSGSPLSLVGAFLPLYLSFLRVSSSRVGEGHPSEGDFHFDSIQSFGGP
jgi:hypothetical protein